VRATVPVSILVCSNLVRCSTLSLILDYKGGRYTDQVSYFSYQLGFSLTEDTGLVLGCSEAGIVKSKRDFSLPLFDLQSSAPACLLNISFSANNL
jgi:hypothetical protein